MSHQTTFNLSWHKFCACAQVALHDRLQEKEEAEANSARAVENMAGLHKKEIQELQKQAQELEFVARESTASQKKVNHTGTVQP